ncbi:MAG: carboxypeptidase-like regulatory domain-containing protein [Candidatus Paceibacterota bacterium]
MVNSISSFVKDNPEILIPVSVVGVVSPYIPSILGNIAGIISIPIRIWNIIPTLLGFRRRKRPWGTVFDSVTKQPLDPVYVMLKDSFGKEISTSITDLDGRYGFQVPAGQYSIFANKANYTFPSVKLVGKTEDELYHDLYFGETLSVEKDGEVIQKIFQWTHKISIGMNLKNQITKS